MQRRTSLRAAIAIPLSVALLLSGAVGMTPAFADVTFTVDDIEDLSDAAPGNGACATSAGTCTLRAAVEEANALAGNDTIELPGYQFKLSSELFVDPVTATDTLTIRGVGMGGTVIDGDNPLTWNEVDGWSVQGGDYASVHRVFDITGGAGTVLEDLTIRGGGVFPEFSSAQGGGVNVASGTFTADGVEFIGNAVAQVGSQLGGSGGALALSAGAATITGSRFIGNAADDRGAAILAEGAGLTVSNTHFEGNGEPIGLADINGPTSDFTSFWGGAISAVTPITVDGSTFLGNASRIGGGIYLFPTAASSQVIDSNFVGNDAPFSGGAIDAGADVTISGGRFEQNTSIGYTGGVETNGDGTINFHAGGSLDGALIRNNSAWRGGGVASTGGAGSVTVSNTSIIENTSVDDGGGVFITSNDFAFTNTSIIGNNAGGFGGAVLLNSSFPTVTLDHVTVAHNTSVDDYQVFAFDLNRIHMTDSIIDWDPTAQPQCAGVEFDGGNLVNDQASCINFSDNGGNDLLAGDILNRNNGTSASAVGGGQWGLLIDQGHASNDIATSCGSTDGRGVAQRSTGCTPGAVELGHFWVNTDQDVAGTLGDGICDAGFGICSLREAIREAHTLSGKIAVELSSPLGTFYDVNANDIFVDGNLDSGGDVLLVGNAVVATPPTTISQTVSGFRLFDLIDGGSLEVISLQLEASGPGTPVGFGGLVAVTGGSTFSAYGSDLAGGHGTLGGAIAVNGGFVTLEQLQVLSNTADDDGGAIFADNISDVFLRGVIFEGNQATNRGGAIAATAGAIVDVTDGEFNLNGAGSYGGALDATLDTALYVHGALFDTNTAGTRGGAIYAQESIVSVEPTSHTGSAFGQRPNFTGNDGGFDGAISATDPIGGYKLTVDGSTFDNNTGSTAGAINVGLGIEQLALIARNTFTNHTTHDIPGTGAAVQLFTNGAGGVTLAQNSFLFNHAETSGPVEAATGGAVYALVTPIDGWWGNHFEGNTAFGNGGAVYLQPPAGQTPLLVDDTLIANTSDFEGGGYYINGSADLRGIHADNNQGIGHAGAIAQESAAPLFVSDSTFIGNNTTGDGGAIRLQGDGSQIDNTTFDGNQSSGSGGAVSVRIGSSLAVTQSVFDFNDALGGDGGAIESQSADLSVDGSSFTMNTGSAGGAIEFTFGSFTLLNSAFADNIATSVGGAIDLALIETANGQSAVLSDVDFIDNRSGSSGGALSASTVDLTANGLSFTGNQADAIGGGGLDHFVGSGLVQNSAFVGNSALGTFNSDGGGAYINQASYTFENTTFSGNSAPNTSNSGDGGGLFVDNGAVVSLDHVTIANNHAGMEGGGLAIDPTAAASVSRSIIADNTTSGAGPDCFGVILAGAQYNIVEDQSSCAVPADPTNVSADPILDPISGSGSDQAHTIPAGSPAVNAIPTIDCTQLVDQRLTSRPLGGACDIGAIESPAAPVVSVDLSVDQSFFAPGASIVSTSDIPPTKLKPRGTTQSTGTETADVLEAPISAIPISAIPISAIPINAIPISAIDAANPGVATVLNATPMNELSLLSPIGPWATIAEILAASTRAGAPAQSVTFNDMVNDANVGPTIAAAPISAIDWGATPISAIPISAIPISAIPISAIDNTPSDPWNGLPWMDILGVPGAPSPEGHTAALCAYFDTHGFDCGDIGLFAPDWTPPNQVTILDAAVAGAPISAIPISAIPISAISVDAIPISGIPISAITLESSPISAIPISAIPISAIHQADSTPISAIPISAIPISAIDPLGSPISGIPISAIPISAIAVTGTPISAIPISGIPISAIDAHGAPISGIPISAIDPLASPISAIPISAIPISAIPISAIPISAIPISAINAAASPISAIPISAISAANRANVIKCSVVDCNSATLTLGEAADQNALRLGATFGLLDGAFSGTNIALSALLAYVDPSRPELANTTLGDLGTYGNAELGDVLPLTNMTLGQLFQLLAGTQWEADLQELMDTATFGDLDLGLTNLTIGDLLPILLTVEFAELLKAIQAGSYADIANMLDVILAMIPPSLYPWENVDVSGGGLQEALGENATFVTYTADIVASDLGGGSVEIVLNLPDGSHVGSNASAAVTSDGFSSQAPLTVSGNVVSLSVPPPVNGTMTVTIHAATPLSLGSQSASMVVTHLPSLLSDTDTTEFSITEEFEPNDTIQDLVDNNVPDLVNGQLMVSHIGTPGDVDLNPITLGPGEALSVFLGNVPDDADLDLIVYGPAGSDVPGVGANSVNGETQLADDLKILDDRPAVGFSTRRDTDSERVDLPPVHFPGEYIVQVVAYNDGWSGDPYTLQTKTFPAPSLPQCEPWPGGLATTQAGAPAVTLPAVDADTETLLVVNRDRYEGAHGSVARAELDQLLADVANLDGSGTTPVVNGAILDVSDVVSYAAWNTTNGRCEVQNAIDVATDVAAEINAARAVAPNVQHVVIVGDDSQIPMGRVPDFVEISNERTYKAAVARVDSGGQPVADELLAAVAFGYYRTDNIFGDSQPEIVSNRPVYVPEVAIGRLVENHDEIAGQLQRFIDFDGQLDPVTEQFVAGYDFLADGSNEVADNLDAQPGAPTTDRLIDDYNPVDPWDNDDLLAALTPGAPDATEIISINAHYDHTRLQSSAEDDANSQVDLLNATEISGDYVGSIVFTMGCHSGLNVSDISIGGVTDWAQHWAGDQGALYVGNEGYGYGDTDLVALSERLMADFATGLNPSLTVGQALAFAKAEYAADLTAYGVYDEKVLMEATFYGMPMHRIGLAPPPPTPPQEVELTTDHGLLAQTGLRFEADVTSGPSGSGTDLYPVTESFGSHYAVSVDGETISPAISDQQPTQPRWEIDVTAHNGFGALQGDARGAVIEDIADTTVITGMDPIVGTPIVDQATERTEFYSNDLLFPSVFTKVARVPTQTATPNDQLSFIPGHFKGTSDEGEQLLFTDVGFTVYYAPLGNTDYERPTIQQSTAGASGGSIGFSIRVRDDEGPIQRVLVQYIEPNDPQWRAAELAFVSSDADGETWTGGAALNGTFNEGDEISYFVQAVDAVGNRGISTAKAEFHGAVVTAPPDGPGTNPGGETPATPAADGPKSGDWYTGPVTVSTDGDDDEDAVLIINGQRYETTPGTPNEVVLTESNTYQVTVEDEGESTTTFVFVDVDAPEITFHSPPEDSGAKPLYGLDHVVPTDIEVTDKGSGLASVSSWPEYIDTSDLGGESITVTAEDHAGHVTVKTQEWDVVLLDGPDDPVVTGQTTQLIINGTPDKTGIEVDWGDGNGFVAPDPSDVTVDAPNKTITIDHVFTEKGLYEVGVRRGGGTVVTFSFIAVYPSDEGHVTGNVLYVSPFGAVASNPWHTGIAHLAVSTSYEAGDSVPSGDTQLHFLLGSGRFEAESFEQLSIDGNRAQWWGEGTINGVEGYHFTAIVVDRALDSDGEPVSGFIRRLLGTADKVRMVIWRDLPMGGEQLVYDNKPGSSLDGNAGTYRLLGDITIEAG